MHDEIANRKIWGIIARLEDQMDKGEYSDIKDTRNHIVNLQLKAKYSHLGPDWWEQADKFKVAK